MAGNKQRFTYEINADIGQAKKAINDLQRSIDNLSKKQISTNYLDAGINKAVNSAKELQYHLNKALNTDTGKLNLNAFSQSLAQSNLSAKDLMQNLLQGGTAGQQAFTSLAGVIAQSEVPLKRMNSTLKNFATTLKNTIKWEISSTMIHGLERSLRGAVSYAKNLNTSLTNIRIVTGQSVDDMARFAKEANVAAKALSTTTKSYADASLIYYQQGDSQELAAKKAAITIKAANSSFESSAKEMSEYLTAVWNSYQVGADELERYVDIMASLGAKTATSLEEIATSMQKVAATANTVGVSMEQVSSIIATVSSVTRESAESIGTSYKTIFARIGDLKLGQTDEDGIGLGQVSSQLDAIGVKILDESGNLREMGDIIIDLGTKWQTMNQAQKTAIAQVVAGKRQYTQLMALFENWDMFQSNMNIAENSEGALQDMADIYAESWEAASARVKASMEAIYSQIFNDQLIIKLTNGFASITDTISSVIEGLGGLKGVFLHLGAIGTKVFSNQIATAIDNTKKSITTFISQFHNDSFKDIFTKFATSNIKSVEAINYSQNTTQWRAALQQASTSSAGTNEVDSQVRRNAETILILKEQLLAAENNLSKAQTQRAQNALNELDMEQNGLVEILRLQQERQEILRKQSLVASASISRNLAINRPTDPAQQSAYDQKAEAIKNESKTIFSDTEKTYKDIGLLGSAIQGLQKGALNSKQAIKLLNTELKDETSIDKYKKLRKQVAGLGTESEKVKKLISALEQLSDTLGTKNVQAIANFIQKLKEVFKNSPEIIAQIDQTFNEIIAEADGAGQATGEAFVRKMEVEAKKSKFMNTISQKLDPKKLETFGKTLTTTTSAAFSMGSMITSVSHAIDMMGDDSISTAQKLSSLVSVFGSLGSVIKNVSDIASGKMGWVGAGLYLTATVVSTIAGAVDAHKRNQREQYEKEFEITSSRSSDRVEKITEEEKELQSILSTYNNLYERYKAGEDVQNELSESASALADAYGLTGAAVATVTGNFEAFNEQVKETLTLDEQLAKARIAKNLSGETVAEHQLEKELNQTFEELIHVDSPNKMQQALDKSGLLDIIIESAPDYTIAELFQGASIETDEQGSISFKNNELLNAIYQARDKNIDYMPGTDILKATLVKTLNDNAIGLNKGETVQLSDNFADILQLALDNISLFDTIDASSLFTGAYLDTDNIEGLESIYSSLVGENYEATLKELLARDNGESFSSLIDQNTKKLIWDDNATADEKVATFDLYKEWKEEILERTKTLEKGNVVYDLGQAIIDEIDKIINDPTLSKVVEEYKTARKSEEILKQAESILGQTFGQTTKDFDLEQYTNLWTEVQARVEENKEIYGLDKYKVNSEEYIKARNQAVASIINDYTSLDEWTNVYLSLAETFKNQEQFDSAKSYIQSKKDFKPSDLTASVLNAMKLEVLSGGIQEDGLTDRALAAEQMKAINLEIQKKYDKIKQVAASYDKTLELSDATSIYETFFNENLNLINFHQKSWKEFLDLDADARKTYLQQVSEAYLKQAKQEAQDALVAYEREKTTFENSKAGKMFNDGQAQKLVENIYVDEKGAPRLNKNADPNEIASLQKEVLGSYGFEVNPEGLKAFLEAMSLAGEKSKEIDANITSAENTLQGYELMDTDNDRAVDRINRMKEAISQLPKDMKEFDKLVKQLGNIDPAKLIEMSDLERAEEILQHLEQPTEAQFTKWNPETQKNDFDAAGYAEALQAWREANQQAVDVIMNSANEAFTQIENHMNHAREEAEKTKTIAETLSRAVQTGELTETQKLGMDADLLKIWNEAADAPARAAIAMQQWNKYANENVAAARDILITYSTAKSAIFEVEDIISTGALKDSEKGKENFRGMLAQMDLDDEIKSVWEKAWDQAVSKGIKFDGKSDFEIIELLRDEIGEMGELTKEEMDAVTAAVKDNMAEMFQELHDQNIEQARSAADAWREAFDLINDAKLKLLSGESILEMIAGDPQAILTLAEQTGLSIQEILQGAISNTLDPTKIKDFDINEYVDAEMLANGMFEGFGKGFIHDMYAQGMTFEDGIGWVDSKGNQVSQEKVLGPIYETMLKAINPQATQKQIDEQLKEIFADPAKYTELLVNPMMQLESATLAAGQALQSLTDIRQIEAAGNIENTEAEFRGQKIEYEDLTEVQAAIDRAQQAKYDGKTWESLSQEDRDLLDEYDINFTNVDTAATECATALAACAGAAVQLMEAMARDKGYSQNADGEWGQVTFTDADGNTYTDKELRDKYGMAYDPDTLGLTDNGWTKSDGVTEAFENANEAVEKANGVIQDTDYQTIERMASSVGLTSDELTNFAATLANVNEGVEDFNSLSQDTQKNWLRIAAAALKAQEGWDSLTKSQKDNLKILKKGEEGTTDYIKALSSITSDIKKIFNGSTKVTENFVKDHLDLVEKMSKGDRKAAEELERFLLEDILPDDLENRTITVEVDGETAQSQLTSLLNSFGDQFADKAAGFVVTPEIDTTGASAALMNLMYEGAHTAEAITNALNAIGWEPIIEYKEYPLSDQEKTTGYAETPVYSMINGTATITGTKTIPLSAQMIQDGFVRVPVIGSGKGFQKIGGGASGAKKPSGSGGGGSGGSQKKEMKPLIRGRDEIERYHKQNDTIERLSSQLEEIDKLKDRAYGKDHIAQIEAETDALNKQLIAQQDLHDEALKWMAADKADLAKYGAEYDENGTIVNYERVMERIIDEYNSAIERYNNSGQGDGDKLALEAAEQIFEDAKKAIENYEEALGIANDSANEMLEIQNQMSELEVEKITYELELKMEMNERDLEMLEYYQEKYSEELENQDKLFNTFIQSAAEYEDNLAQLGKAYEDLSRQYAAGLINEAHYAEAVTELQEEIVDNLNSLQEIQSELAEAYSETLELAREEIERTTDAIDHSNEALQSFMDITRLTGNDAEYKKIGKFYDQMYANNLTKIEVQKAHLDALLEEEERFQEKIRNGQQLTELEKAEYAALSEQIQETRDTLLSSVVESLEVVRESYENTINSIADDLDNFMAGAAGSMEYLQEQYGYFQEEQERYVSTTKELYEVSKLNRDIEGTLATTTSSAAKEALKALQEKINKQSELNELTEYDIEMNQLQYQLLLARIKLEESQNAKDTVRLTRDENGNYAYRYTANQDKIDEAAQHYEDILQQINDTTVQRTSEIEQQLLNTMSNYKEKFQEIATDYSLTEEERLMRLEELNNQFSETMRYLQEQNNIVTNNLTANQEAIAGHYGVAMSEITASTAGNVNNTIQSMIDKTEEYIAVMNNAIFGEEGAQSAWQKYLAQLGDIEGSADVAYDSLLGNAQEMGEMNGFAAEEALEVIQTLRDTLDPLEALSSAWDAHNTILEATISNYENLAQVIQGALSAIGQIPNGGTANVDGAHKYAKGGLVDYTGLAWVDGTASDPEMMLNPGDTQNILKATAMVKSLDSGFIGSLVESVKSAAAAMLHMFGGAYHAVTNVHTANDSALDQNVHITAEFPNVQNHTEIEEAFDNLINQAAQFAHRKN